MHRERSMYAALFDESFVLFYDTFIYLYYYIFFYFFVVREHPGGSRGFHRVDETDR